MPAADQNVKMGFEGQIKCGTAGSTGTTLLENVRDINYNLDHERGDTTVRGDSTVAPMKTEQTTQRVASIEWEMIYDVTDTAFVTVYEAAMAGDGLAIRTLSHATGKGFDGDATITVQDSMPLNGEQVKKFTATPSRAYGRDPVPYI